MKNKKPLPWKTIISIFLLVTLVFSVVYAIVAMVNAPSTPPEGDPHGKVKSDYTLMLIQCVLGLVVMFAPSFFQRKFSIDIPRYIYILYFVFLYCAIYLGEVRNFYFIIPHWDTILHIFSGAMLGAMGFVLVDVMNKSDKVKISLSPFFVAFFAFCFALAAGAVWEIYEFTIDSVMGLNMQKFMLEDGTLLVGQAALEDTMVDLVVDGLGALVFTVFSYFSLKREGKREPEGGK